MSSALLEGLPSRAIGIPGITLHFAANLKRSRKFVRQAHLIMLHDQIEITPYLALKYLCI